jgi:general stress protein CsbA
MSRKTSYPTTLARVAGAVVYLAVAERQNRVTRDLTLIQISVAEYGEYTKRALLITVVNLAMIAFVKGCVAARHHEARQRVKSPRPARSCGHRVGKRCATR